MADACRRRTSDASQRLVGGELSRAASIAGFEDPLGDDNDCGICLEAELDVAVNGCNHKLCIDCSIRCVLHILFMLMFPAHAADWRPYHSV